MKCPVCNETDHASDAIFCHVCGSRMVKRKPKWLWLVGIIVLLLAVLYRLLIYANYLNVSGAHLSDKGGATTIHVETDAVFVSLRVQNEDWFTVTQSGKNIIVNVKENEGARDRQTSFTVMTGVIGSKRRISKKVTIIQAGKGATYIKAEPQSIELTERGNNRASTKTVRVETDGDNWEIVTCPDWVWYNTDGNKLELAAKTVAGQNREGVIMLKSHNEYTNVCVLQKTKSKPIAATLPTTKPTVAPPPLPTATIKPEQLPAQPKPMQPTTAPVVIQPDPKPLPSYNVQYYSVLDASSFSRIMVIDKEVDGETAFALVKKYKQEGWRPLIRSELLFVLESHRDMLPRCEHGYWIQYNNTGDLQSLSYGYEGNVDPTPNENRIAFVK